MLEPKSYEAQRYWTLDMIQPLYYIHLIFFIICYSENILIFTFI